MAHRDFSPASQDTPIPVSSTSVPASSTSVFINHHDLKVQKTLASHLHRRLRDHGLEVFFKWLQLAGGDIPLTCEIEGHIREASVHVAVFSPGFAESRWCLNELMLRLESMKNPESGLKIIPVFYGVEPSELRWTKGVYAKALRNFQKKNKSESNTIEKWRKALYEVAEKTGFELRAFNGDEGKLVDKIVKRVLKMLENHLYYHVFINHRGPDTKRTLASHLYHCLLAHGLRVFLDTEELQKGAKIFSQIEGAIATASVHIAIFSPRYAESKWCLDELILMLKSRSTIIPVFYHVKPSEVRWTRRDHHGPYSQALNYHKSRGRFDTATIEGWRNALSQAADISGFELGQYNNDEGELVHKVVQECCLDLRDATRRKDLEEMECGHM